MKHQPAEIATADLARSRRKAGRMTAALFFVLAIASGVGCYLLLGQRAFVLQAEDAGWQIVSLIPHVLLGLLIAAAVSVLAPRERVARWLGEESGTRGLVIATVLGALMPGGPFASFPLVFALAQAGADIGALIAFLVAWAAVGVNRLLIWEIPFMGFEFGMLRFLSSLPLPLLAGGLARLLCVRFPNLRSGTPQ